MCDFPDNNNNNSLFTLTFFLQYAHEIKLHKHLSIVLIRVERRRSIDLIVIQKMIDPLLFNQKTNAEKTPVEL